MTGMPYGGTTYSLTQTTLGGGPMAAKDVMTWILPAVLEGGYLVLMSGGSTAGLEVKNLAVAAGSVGAAQMIVAYFFPYIEVEKIHGIINLSSGLLTPTVAGLIRVALTSWMTGDVNPAFAPSPYIEFFMGFWETFVTDTLANAAAKAVESK